jgi:predicted ATPase
MTSKEFYKKNHKFSNSIVSMYETEIIELMDDFVQEKRQDLKEELDSQEFYDLMQTYRHSPIGDQHMVVENFEAIKVYILEKLKNEI